MLKKNVSILLLIFTLSKAYSQITVPKNITLKKCLTQIEKQTKYTFSYSETAIDVNQKLNKSFKNSTLNIFLNYLYQTKNIKSSINNKQVLLFPSKNKKIKVISGYIKDSITKEVLIFASVFDNISKKGTTTNEYGYYSLATKKDSLNLTISYVGYPKKHKLIVLKQDKNSDILLSPNNDLKEIIITGNKSELSNKQGIIELNPEDYKKAPTLKGENDPIQTLTLLPGISFGDNQNYINVRGGEIGENMIMIDGVSIYKMTHAGKISVVNGDVINKTTLYKANFPSRFSGRTSSILDFRIKNGNTNKTKAVGNVGFETFKIAIDGPLGNKLTYLFSARRNYGGGITNKLFNSNVDFSNFYDLYGKVNLNHKKGNISISSFLDVDNSTRIEESYIDSTSASRYRKNIFENKNLSSFITIQSNVKLNKKLFWNSQVTYYDYAVQHKNKTNNSLSSNKNTTTLNNNSHIQDGTINNYFLLTKKKHTYNFGLNYTYHNMFSFFESDILNYQGKVNIHDISSFFEDKFQLNEKINLKIGSALSFYSFGKDYSFNIEPRMSGEYKINKYSKLAGSFSRMAQYLHLIPFNLSNTSPYQSEIWQSSTKKFSPLKSNILSFSYSNSFINNLPFTIETYYKLSQSEKNITESNLEKLFFGIESIAFNGHGHNYGIEFLIEKKGKLSGWISYAWSRSNKKFKELNAGNSFPSNYNRKHIFNLVATYPFNKKITANINFKYQSGIPFYIKKSNQQDIDTSFSNNIYRNKEIKLSVSDILSGKHYRFPVYKELNIQVSFTKKKKWGERIWQIGIKNILFTENYNNYILGKDPYGYKIGFETIENGFYGNTFPYVTFRFKFK